MDHPADPAARVISCWPIPHLNKARPQPRGAPGAGSTDCCRWRWKPWMAAQWPAVWHAFNDPLGRSGEIIASAQVAQGQQCHPLPSRFSRRPHRQPCCRSSLTPPRWGGDSALQPGFPQPLRWRLPILTTRPRIIRPHPAPVRPARSNLDSWSPDAQGMLLALGDQGNWWRLRICQGKVAALPSAPDLTQPHASGGA